MREIRVVHLDKARPAVVLTRRLAQPSMNRVTVAPITSTIKGLSSEVRLGSENGLDHESVISVDNVQTVSTKQIGRKIGALLYSQERELARAIVFAYDLDVALPDLEAPTWL